MGCTAVIGTECGRTKLVSSASSSAIDRTRTRRESRGWVTSRAPAAQEDRCGREAGRAPWPSGVRGRRGSSLYSTTGRGPNTPPSVDGDPPARLVVHHRRRHGEGGGYARMARMCRRAEAGEHRSGADGVGDVKAGMIHTRLSLPRRGRSSSVHSYDCGIPRHESSSSSKTPATTAPGWMRRSCAPGWRCGPGDRLPRASAEPTWRLPASTTTLARTRTVPQSAPSSPRTILHCSVTRPAHVRGEAGAGGTRRGRAPDGAGSCAAGAGAGSAALALGAISDPHRQLGRESSASTLATTALGGWRSRPSRERVREIAPQGQRRRAERRSLASTTTLARTRTVPFEAAPSSPRTIPSTTGDPPRLVHHARGADVGVDPCAGVDRLRDYDLQGVLLGVECAAQLTEAGQLAPHAVVGEDAPLSTPAPLHAATESVKLFLLEQRVGDLRHRQIALDRFEAGSHLGRRAPFDGVTLGPQLEDLVRRPLAEVGIVDRAPGPRLAPGGRGWRGLSSCAPPRPERGAGSSLLPSGRSRPSCCAPLLPGRRRPPRRERAPAARSIPLAPVPTTSTAAAGEIEIAAVAPADDHGFHHSVVGAAHAGAVGRRGFLQVRWTSR